MSASVGFTGTQDGMTDQQHEVVRQLFEQLGAHAVLHHGMCVGSDEQAHRLGRARGWYVVGHPCTVAAKQVVLDVDVLRPVKPPLDRNTDIVYESQYLVATPAEDREVLRSGTWATVRRGRKRGIPVYLVLPDGRLELQ